MKHWILPYLAGIIDGEGSIRIEADKKTKRGKCYYRLRLSVSNSDYGLMQFLLENFSGSFIKELKRSGNRRQQYSWQLASSRRVIEIIESIFPYLIVKKKRAEVALRASNYLRGYGSRITLAEQSSLILLYQEMKTLNQRGFRRADTGNE